jgi:hypothetical protein
MLKLKPGESTQIENTITPPNIKIPSRYIDVPPDTDAQQQKFVRVPVKSGDLLSVIVDRITKGTAPAKDERSAVKKQHPDSGYQKPGSSDFTPDSGGSISGSWDGFGKSNFVIHGAASLKVPKGVETLSLTIQYPREGNTSAPRLGFRVQVVETEVKDVNKALTSMVTRDPAFEDLRLPLGVNLPTWIICGERPTGRVLTIEKEKFREMESIGCYGYIVRSIGKQGADQPR